MGILEALGKVGNVLDLPGSSLRDALVGEDPWDQWGSMTSGENRSTGRDLLRHYNLAGEEDTTLNFLGGLLTEMAVDPLNLIGGALVGRKALQRSGATKANRAIRENVEPRVFDDFTPQRPFRFDEMFLEDVGMDPDVAYHVSPFGKEIEEAGRLIAPRQADTAMLKTVAGDPIEWSGRRGLGVGQGVSMTVDPSARVAMERWFRSLASIGEAGRKAEAGDATKVMLKEYYRAADDEIGDFLSTVGDDLYDDVRDWPRTFTEDAVETLRNPASSREEVAEVLGVKYQDMIENLWSRAHEEGVALPPGFGGGISGAIGVDPDNIRVFEVPLGDLKTDLGIDEGEYLFMGDVPLEGARVHGAPGGSYTYELPFEDVPSLSPLLKALTAERVVNKGLNQFPSGGYYEDPIY